MTAFDYTKPQATASRLLERFGKAGAIRRNQIIGGTPFSPVTGPVDHACTLAVMRFSSNEIDGTRIRADDLKVYVSTSGLTIEPTTADKIVIDGQAYSIVNATPLKPAGVVVFHQLQCRR